MILLDIFVMAQENAPRLASECAKHTGAVVEFAQSVERDGRLSARAVVRGDEVTPQTEVDAIRFTALRTALAKWSLQEVTV
jgi:hypothetical protein